MLAVDENLIRATERWIDGGYGHHYYATIHQYRLAAQHNNLEAFAKAERALRQWVLFRSSESMPDAYREAIDLLINRANTEGVNCKKCGRKKLLDTKCPGPGEGPCWAIRKACDGSDGRCCKCAAEARARASGEPTNEHRD